MSPGDSGASKMPAFSAMRDGVELFGSTLQPRWERIEAQKLREVKLKEENQKRREKRAELPQSQE